MEAFKINKGENLDRSNMRGTHIAALLAGALLGSSASMDKSPNENLYPPAAVYSGPGIDDDSAFDESPRMPVSALLEKGKYADTAPLIDKQHEPALDSLVAEVNATFSEQWPTPEQRKKIQMAIANYHHTLEHIIKPNYSPERYEDLTNGLALLVVSDVRFNPNAIGVLLQELAADRVNQPDADSR